MIERHLTSLRVLAKGEVHLIDLAFVSQSLDAIFSKFSTLYNCADVGPTRSWLLELNFTLLFPILRGV
jgi:hypothetical protein